ncbi:MAG: 4Fe-4S dicluster domain-containing protein [Dehalococcoidia bacterium]|nr:4Fe-4S dicluster domain-containing protein [Dehalococcoidia bacterium]
MRYESKSCVATCDSAFAAQVRKESGVAFERCYQCLTCTLGCPVAKYMDYRPNEVIRLVQLGLKKEVLTCSTIWICASCEACFARCPNEINIPHLMDTLHQMTLRHGIRPKETRVAAFHLAFLDPVKRFGRQNEALMSAEHFIRSRDFSLKTLKVAGNLGIGMITKGKIKITPARTGKGAARVRKLFKHTMRGTQP